MLKAVKEFEKQKKELNKIMPARAHSKLAKQVKSAYYFLRDIRNWSNIATLNIELYTRTFKAVNGVELIVEDLEPNCYRISLPESESLANSK